MLTPRPGCSSWPDTFDAWDKASQAYMMAVHQHARPVLNDMERLSTSK
jgi:hypothetical protein